MVKSEFAKPLYADEFNGFKPLDFERAMLILSALTPVLANIIRLTEVMFNTQVKRASTDGIYVYINPLFWDGLDRDGYRAFLLGHEALHILLKHMLRAKMYKAMGYFRLNIPFVFNIWNHACDYIINAYLKAMGHEIIPRCLLDDRFGKDDLADDVYMTLYEPDNKSDEPENSDDKSNDSQESDDSGDSGDSGDSDDSGEEPRYDGSWPEGEDFDEHLEPDFVGDTPEEKAASEEAINESIAESIKESIKQGEAVGDSSFDTYKDTDTSDSNWREELAEYMVCSGRGGVSTYAPIHRRTYTNFGLIAPSQKGVISKIAITQDVSSSVNETSRYNFMAESAELIDQIAPSNGISVLWTSSKVKRVDEIMTGIELLELSIPHGGGTLMSASIDYLLENGIDADLHLIFTDGQMSESDVQECADAGALIVLDRHPCVNVRQRLENAGCDYIIAAS